MKTKCKVAILVFLAIGAGGPQTLSAAEGTPPPGCITVTYKHYIVREADMTNNCGHNDIGVWAGTNWSEPFALPWDGPRDKIEALDIDDSSNRGCPGRHGPAAGPWSCAWRGTKPDTRTRK